MQEYIGDGRLIELAVHYHSIAQQCALKSRASLESVVGSAHTEASFPPRDGWLVCIFNKIYNGLSHSRCA